MKITYFVTLFIGISIFSYNMLTENELTTEVTVLADKKQVADSAIDKDENVFETLAPLKIEVVLKRIYLDGEESEEVIKQTIWSMADFWAQYEEWQLVDQQEGQVVFQKNIDDISPLLKANGYFGLDNEGRLTIYKGSPEEEKVIQSFFQIDVKKLESHLHEQLREGIVIMTKDRYSELLQTIRKYELK